MNTQNITVANILEYEKELLNQQQNVYITFARKINMEMKQMIKKDFGETLAKNCIHDIAGEVVRRYFDLSDYYITADQFINRCLHFSYDNDVDFFGTNEEIRKTVYNMTDSPEFSSSLKNISDTVKKSSQNKLFEEDRKKDGSEKAQKKYRNSKITSDGKIYDELTGKESTVSKIIINGKKQIRTDLQADHIQSRNGAKYNSKYLKTDDASLKKLRDYYNSDANFSMIHASANSSKNDICICEIDGKIKAINAHEIDAKKAKGHTVYDVTYKASAEEIADAIVERWEKDTRSGKKIDKLKEVEYLDENGIVKKDVKEKLIKDIRASQNCESKRILEIINNKTVVEDAFNETKAAFGKIIAGQVIYYVFPPMIFETRTIIKKKNITLDNALSKLKKAGKRVCKYVISKLREILGNVLHNSISKFIKSFFDIIIELVKESVKKLVRIAKELVMSLVSCAKTICDANTSTVEKADAITKTLGVTIGNIVLELIFEYLEKQFGLPDFLMEPLQIIVSVLVTNLIMLILEKLDLFNVQYGLIVANIEQLFIENKTAFIKESELLLNDANIKFEEAQNIIKREIDDIKVSINNANFYEAEITPQLARINEVFNMNIDFDLEWKQFIAVI